jgi:WD40 repeat protein
MWESTHGIFSWGNFKPMFDPKGNVIVVGAANDTAVSITKYHGATGRILWDIIPTFTTNRDHVILDSAGDLIVEGTGGGTEFLAKYKGSTGILLWEKTYGLHTYAGTSLDLEGNVLVQGQLNDATIFIRKYKSSTGGVMWEATHSGSYVDIDFDKNGSVFVVGFNDGFITKSDTSSGALVWEKTFWSPDPSPTPE